MYLVLDVDPNENAASLAAYRAQHSFTGRYAVADKVVARALAAEFGDQFLNPPSTPILVIGTDGQVTRTDFGHKSPDEIVALAEAHGAYVEGLWLAFTLGLASAASPCLLPLYPSFLAYLSANTAALAGRRGTGCSA